MTTLPSEALLSTPNARVGDNLFNITSYNSITSLDLAKLRFALTTALLTCRSHNTRRSLARSHEQPDRRPKNIVRSIDRPRGTIHVSFELSAVEEDTRLPIVSDEPDACVIYWLYYRAVCGLGQRRRPEDAADNLSTTAGVQTRCLLIIC